MVSEYVILSPNTLFDQKSPVHQDLGFPQWQRLMTYKPRT